MLHNLLRAYTHAKKYIAAHKVLSVIVAIALLGGGYWEYKRATNTSGETRYILGSVQTGTIIAAVSGSGQVSPSDQIDIKPRASGDITAVLVRNSQKISAGQAIAYIDSSTPQKAVRDAQANLKSAQIALQKLQQPADKLSMTQAQNAANNAQTALTKAYADTSADIGSVFIDLPDIMTGLKDIVLGTGASKGAQWNIDFYRNATQSWDNNALTYHDAALQTYDDAQTAYNSALADYQALGPTSPNAAIEATAKETYALAKSAQNALTSSNSFIQFYEDQVNNHDQKPSATADTALSNLSVSIGKINTHLSTLLSDTNSITSDQQSVLETAQSLQKLQGGADPLDVESSRLSVTQRENALQDAQDTLADYTIRSPIAGTIANLTIHKGDTVGSAAVATMITSQDIADLSLNEVDAAKIAVGEKATLTFDAIDGLSLTGEVADVSPLGVVSQGVVSYDVKIAFDAQDPRVKAGMTVNASIETAMKQNALAVPSSAVHVQGNRSYVLVFDIPPQGAATAGAQGVPSAVAPRQQTVTTGISDDTDTEITSGLQAGDQVVVRTISGTQASATSQAPSLFGGGVRTGGAVRAGTGAGR